MHYVLIQDTDVTSVGYFIHGVGVLRMSERERENGCLSVFSLSVSLCFCVFVWLSVCVCLCLSVCVLLC